MPLDTRIPLGAQGAQPMRSPIATLGGLAQLREMRDINEQRGLMNEQRRRDLDDDYAIRETLQRLGNPDDAVDELYQNGRAEAAGALSKSLLESRKAAFDAATQRVDTQKKQFDFAANIMKTVTDQASLETARNALKSAVPPDIFQHIPVEYEPERVKQLVGFGMSISEKLSVEQDAIKNAYEAARISLSNANLYEERQKNKLEALKFWTASASNALSTAGSQEEWDIKQRLLAQQGAPIDLLAQFGNRFSPQAVARAKALGMTGSEEATAAHQKVNETQGQQNINLRKQELEQRQAENGAPGTGRGRSVSANEVSDILQKKQSRYDELEKAYRDGAEPGVPLQLDDARRAEMNLRKVQIEDDARAQQGMPSMLEAEHTYAETGDQMKLRQIRNVWKKLTGEETPLEQMEKLAGELKKERDPAKLTELRTKLARVRDQYGEMTGRPRTPKGQ